MATVYYCMPIVANLVRGHISKSGDCLQNTELSTEWGQGLGNRVGGAGEASEGGASIGVARSIFPLEKVGPQRSLSCF